eukprot:GSChrysophyteH1.ASY1.ANO1.3206.1 assembled CDS
MESVWFSTVPNLPGVSPAESLGAIKRATGREGKSCDFFALNIPNLHHGTLDSLIALSDELNKLGPAVENMMKKIERQYFEIQEASGKNALPLKVQEKSVDAYVHHWEWDYARYQHQGKKLSDLVNQISAQSSSADEELKKLLAGHTERTASLASWQRKKTVNLGTSDFEDFLTIEEAKAIEVLDNDNLVTLMRVLEVDGQCLYAVTILRGHTLSGHAFREHRCTARLFTMDLTKGVSVDSQIEKAQADWNASASTIARWSAAHFGDIVSAYMHLKVINAYVESVLRYGVPVDICAFIIIPLPGQSVAALSALTNAINELRPHLSSEFGDDLEDEIDDGHLTFVLQQFGIATGAGEIPTN